MRREQIDVFVRDFLTALKPAIGLPTARDVLAEVRTVCSAFQARGREDIRLSTVPLAFWTQVSSDFVDVYMGVQDDTDLLPHLRTVLRSRIRSFAQAYNIAPEENL